MVFAKRSSIGLMMAFVVLVAVDIGILRFFWASRKENPAELVGLVTLPMASLLLLLLPRIRKENPSRRFWVGFEVVGWVVVLGVGLASSLAMDAFFWPLVALLHAFGVDTVEQDELVITAVVALYTIPQVLLALIGGQLAAGPGQTA